MSAAQQGERFGIDGDAFAIGDTARALGPKHWQRLCALDAPSAPTALCALPAQPAWRATYDIVIAGGGLSTLLAPLLARAGARVAVVERTRAGGAHREWNASEAELQQLVACGLCTQKMLTSLIVARYRTGSCRWHGHAPTYVDGVLDCAVDAAALLSVARSQAIAAGVDILDGAIAGQQHATAHGVAVAVQRGNAVGRIDAGVLIDARGVQSPYARADLLCPTVGGVFEGLRQGDGPTRWQPDVGEILASTEGTEDGVQHLWEAFPGRAGQLTVYLFAYVPAARRGAAPLANLYQRFWRTLPRFKQGAPRMLRPTYGIIPGWSRLTRGARAPHARVILVGDAAARHSPLTYCGFGAMLRSLTPTVRAALHVAHGAPGSAPRATHDTALHQATGVLARMMASPPAAPGALNDLLAAAFATLADMGNDAYASLLQDRMSARDMVRFLWRTSRRHPAVWRYVPQSLGLMQALGWSGRLGMRALAPAAR